MLEVRCRILMPGSIRGLIGQQHVDRLLKVIFPLDTLDFAEPLLSGIKPRRCLTELKYLIGVVA